jgi:hypothetical protein
MKNGTSSSPPGASRRRPPSIPPLTPVSPRKRGGSSTNRVLLGYAFVVSAILVLQVSQQVPAIDYNYAEMTLHHLSSQLSTNMWDTSNPLAIPSGEAQNLPFSPTAAVQEENDIRVVPEIWTRLVEQYGVKSVLDIGCGRGIRTLWFQTHGVDALCVGPSNSLLSTMLTPSGVIEHDFSRGPWWPAKTYSACWAEHDNNVDATPFPYVMAFRKCALIFVTLQEDPTLEIRKFRAYGFLPETELTQQELKSETNLHAFVNPVVAALPEHADLFPCSTKNCHSGRVRLTDQMNQQWKDILTKHGIHSEDLLLGAKKVTQEEREKRLLGKDSSLLAPSAAASNHPLLRWKRGELELAQLPPLPVAVWPYLEFGIGNAESMHIEENGINESKQLFLADSLLNLTDPNVIWVGDTGYAFGWNKWCSELQTRVVKAKDARREVGLPLQWPIFIVDFTDGAAHQRCKGVEEEVGEEFVSYSIRSIVSGRRFVNQSRWVENGKLINLVHNNVTYRYVKDGFVMGIPMKILARPFSYA